MLFMSSCNSDYCNFDLIGILSVGIISAGIIGLGYCYMILREFDIKIDNNIKDYEEILLDEKELSENEAKDKEKLSYL